MHISRLRKLKRVLNNLPSKVFNRARLSSTAGLNNWRLVQISRKITAHARLEAGRQPVVFFNASTRLVNISLNAAFSFLASCAVQLSGVPVVHFACNAGLNRCVLGTDRMQPSAVPPCEACISQSRYLFSNAPTVWLNSSEEPDLEEKLAGLDLDELSRFEHSGHPLGELVLPGLRWALRRHHLADDEATRFLLREYMLSAHRLGREFAAFLDQVEPAAVVLFNGLMYPEAVASRMARQRGIRVITHEVGMQPFSAFFTEGEATAYPIDIPEDFELDPDQNARLDQYLEQRFQGKFSMAGIQFWPEINGLDEAFLKRAAEFDQIVPVFTNVIFDTSQLHANTVFAHMYAWLDQVLGIIREHPSTLFVIRAHPDELRTGKQSQESVQDWVSKNQVLDLPNVVFINSDQYISSYELIQRAKFVMVYNSSIGLEASLMGKAVLCAGKARFTQIPTVFFPDTPAGYRALAGEFLEGGTVDVPVEFSRNARRFLYLQLYRYSLPFNEYLDAHVWPGFVRLRNFHWQKLSPQVSSTMRVVVDGIVNGKPFTLREVNQDG
jgi:hypothetical protein